MIFIGEKVFKAKANIRYIFQKGINRKQYLIIGLSAFAKIGQPPKYNYLRSLSATDCNKLFILDDYGPRGCYYLGENRQFSIEESVISLIKHIAQENNIEFSNIITVGSSKGGYASLYFGLKYGFGYVVAGAPQYYLGDYLFTLNNTNIAEYISGGKSIEDRQYLNRLLPDVIDNCQNTPKISILVGTGDRHYEQHVLPLTKALEQKKIDFRLDIVENIGHSNIGSYFPDFCRKVTSEILGIHNDKVISKLKPELNVDQLNKEYSDLELKLFNTQEELRRIKQSTSFHVGNLMIKAIRNPGRNTILLPYRLLNLFIKHYKNK